MHSICTHVYDLAPISREKRGSRKSPPRQLRPARKADYFRYCDFPVLTRRTEPLGLPPTPFRRMDKRQHRSPPILRWVLVKGIVGKPVKDGKSFRLICCPIDCLPTSKWIHAIRVALNDE